MQVWTFFCHLNETLIYLCISTSLLLGFGKHFVSEVLSISLYFDSSFLNFSFQWATVRHLKWIATAVHNLELVCQCFLKKGLNFCILFFHLENRYRNSRLAACAIVSDNTCIWNCWQHWNCLLIYNFAFFLGCTSLCCAASKSVRLLWSKFLLCQLLCQCFFCLLPRFIYLFLCVQSFWSLMVSWIVG